MVILLRGAFELWPCSAAMCWGASSFPEPRMSSPRQTGLDDQQHQTATLNRTARHIQQNTCMCNYAAKHVHTVSWCSISCGINSKNRKLIRVWADNKLSLQKLLFSYRGQESSTDLETWVPNFFFSAFCCKTKSQNLTQVQGVSMGAMGEGGALVHLIQQLLFHLCDGVTV